MLSRPALLLCLAAGTLSVGLLACGDGPSRGQDEVKTPPLSDAAVEAANVKFKTLCITCHGADGKGVLHIIPKPRDYTNAEWQDSVTDEYLATIIVGGGPSVGKSVLMPPNPDLKDKPDVVNALVQKVRAFRK
jgi:mono/diheme cytochrome c family protein